MEAMIGRSSLLLEIRWTSIMIAATGKGTLVITLMAIGLSLALITKFLNNKISEIN